jgi:hypothetical protein
MSTDTALGELLSWVAGPKRRRGRSRQAGADPAFRLMGTTASWLPLPWQSLGKVSRQVPGKGPTFRPSIL